MPRRHARPAIVAAIALLALTGHAQAGQDIHVAKKTRPDTELVVRGFAPHDGNCRALSLPTITVTQAPANGDVDQRPGKVKTGPNWVGDASCEGVVYDGVQVWYRPHAGFVGVDHFAMRVDYPGRLGRVDADVLIEVTAQAPAASAATP